MDPLAFLKTRWNVSGTHWFLFTLGWWRWQLCRHYDGWRGRIHWLAGVIWRPGSCCWKRGGRKEKSESCRCVCCFHMRSKQPRSESLSGNGVISQLIRHILKLPGANMNQLGVTQAHSHWSMLYRDVCTCHKVRGIPQGQVLGRRFQTLVAGW